MSAASLPLHSRVPSVTASVLAWVGAVAYPLLLVSAVAADGDRDPAFPTVAVLAVLSFLPFALLRRHPAPALPLMACGWIGVIAMRPVAPFGYLQLVVLDLAVGYIAATRRRAGSVVAAVAIAVVQLGLSVLFSPGTQIVNGTVLVLLAIGLAWLVGNSLRVRRANAESARAQAQARAVADERLRIARDLHDVVAHSIGIIAIQAGVGARVIDTQPAEARNALDTIETTSRETLAGLRRTVTALRRAGREDAPLEPAPGLDDLERLAAATGAAGVRVRLRLLGERRPLPPDVDLAAYRIVQESLTNVVRHAGTNHCRVVVTYGPADVHVEVTDEGRGGPVGEAGYGLAGMRERVELVDGDLIFGPRAEGGFRVSARLPLPEPYAAAPAERADPAT